jgi:tRNA(Ile)-lysidine synthase
VPGAEALLRRIRGLAGRQGPLTCAVAWSGGLDSTLLLHLLCRVRRQFPAQLKLRAIHVDHGLQPAATSFRRFCERTARRWRVPLTVLAPRVEVPRGGSVEEAARRARRGALAGALVPGELLLTAQHADDQLETTLLALVRGAGPRGLAGMPARMPLGPGWLLRPLLDVERTAIAAAAREAELEWVEDPTNADTRYDRNYLRTRVLPVLRGRWPSVAATVARSARHCASAVELLEAASARDLAAAADGPDLAIAVLRRFPAARRAEVLRAWIRRSGARAPNERHLDEIAAMMSARPDAHPLLVLPDCKVRRVGGRLVLER